MTRFEEGDGRATDEFHYSSFFFVTAARSGVLFKGDSAFSTSPEVFTWKFFANSVNLCEFSCVRFQHFYGWAVIGYCCITAASWSALRARKPFFRNFDVTT